MSAHLTIMSKAHLNVRRFIGWNIRGGELLHDGYRFVSGSQLSKENETVYVSLPSTGGILKLFLH